MRLFPLKRHSHSHTYVVWWFFGAVQGGSLGSFHSYLVAFGGFFGQLRGSNFTSFSGSGRVFHHTRGPEVGLRFCLLELEILPP